jgi:hypothetical protein
VSKRLNAVSDDTPRSNTSVTIGSQADVNASEGTVVGAPRLWLQLEGGTLLVGSLIAFSTTHRSWWLVPLVLFIPDLLMAGYLGGTRIGAHAYNLAHSSPLPALMVGYGWWQNRQLFLALGLVWLGHIGMDRLLAFGLKYPDHFQHTHLSSPHNSSEGQQPVESYEPRRPLPETQSPAD